MTTRIASTLAAFAKNEGRIMNPFREDQRLASEKRRKLVRAYIKRRMASDPASRTIQTLRCRLGAALRAQGATIRRAPGTSATKRMLGCSVEYLREYLAAFFAPGMSWDNYGEWEIDHVKPCRAFDLSQRSEQFACFHYTNLQPVWMTENRRKSDKWKGLRARNQTHLA